MKYKITTTTYFKKELKTIRKRNKDKKKIKKLLILFQMVKNLKKSIKIINWLIPPDLKIAENVISNLIGYLSIKL